LSITLCGVAYAPSASQPLNPDAGEHSAPKQSESPTKQDKAIRDQRGTEAAPLIVKILNAPSSTPQPDAAETQRLKKPSPDWESPEWATVYATLILAAIGAGQLWMFLRQLRYMRDGMNDAKSAAEAAKESADSLIAGNRAFVFVNRWMFGSLPGSDLKYWVGPEWGNSGNTPPRNLRTHVRCEFKDSALSDDFNFHYHVTEEEVFTAFLGPHANIQGARLPLDGISASECLAIKGGTKFLYLMGWVKYFDIFHESKEHITRFCVRVEVLGDPQLPSMGLKFGFVPHPENNCADEDCKE
jgi:hypothetical protein